MKKFLCAAACLLLLTACAADDAGPPPIDLTRHSGAEAVSLLGDTLPPIVLSDSARQRYENALDLATAALENAPNDPDSIIWVGRRTAYLGRFRDAINIYSAGHERFPDDARFLRHRGHRYITVREFDRAVEDLLMAAQLTAGRQDETEPDGIPNARNIPTSSLQFNIWYHLGLAQYLRGDLQQAADSFRQCLRVSTNPDTQVATRHWLYMILRRQGDAVAARAVLDSVATDMDVIENNSYHSLLLFYKGALALDSLLPPPEAPGAAADAIQDATIAYGLANWDLYNGRAREAEAKFRSILSGSAWTAFGYIAAEAELARMKKE